jgi:pentatricopeptide repeat protein
MFDIFRSIKRIAGLDKKNNKKQKNSQNQKKENQSEESVGKKKIDQVANLFGKMFENVIDEFGNIRQKTKNLQETNFNLGMKYLKDGNLKEAIFRFKITKKFWPEFYEAYYQLIVCLVLNKNFEEAEKIKKELLDKDASYQEKIDLIAHNSQSLQ